MALTINEAVNHKGKDFTGLYGRILPNLSEGGDKITGQAKWYYDKPSYEASSNNNLTFMSGLDVASFSLPTSFSIDYDRDVDGVDILAFATAHITSVLISGGIDANNIVNSLVSISNLTS